MGVKCDPNHTPAIGERAVARMAARQHGLFTRVQALRAGITASTIKHRLRARRWLLALPNVYQVAGTPATWRQRAMAACLHLGPRATLSWRAAATLTGFPTARARRLEVSVTKHRNRSGKHDIIIHIPEEPIPDEDVTTIDGIPVTKPARTLIDLATVEPIDVLERCLDDALRRRLVSLTFLDRWLADPRRKKHRGARVLRRLVDERATRGVTDSEGEAKLLQLIRERGLPLPMLQYVIVDEERFVARVDFAYPEQRVAIEMDSFRHHDTRTTFDSERARGNEVEGLGWRLLRVTTVHVERDPDAVVTWIGRALDL